MFIQNENGLVFIKSKNINVFPCGRRRSSLIDADNSSTTVNDRYYIPFDPEARLNTEANNRKHSGLNGYKQSYLQSWSYTTNDGILALALAGYLFTVNLPSEYRTDKSFGTAIESLLGETDCIYANVKLANVKFFEGSATVQEAGTEILRDQVLTDAPATCLDFLEKNKDKTKSENYFFSGLSFSSKPITSYDYEVASLKVLVKDAGVWRISEAAKLPNIDHGDTKDSVRIPGDVELVATEESSGSLTLEGNLNVAGSLTASSIDAAQITQNGHPTALVDLVAKTDSNGKVTYQLQFTGVSLS